MNTDQINAMILQEQPWWTKAILLLLILSNLATTMCLPLIVWKLYVYNKKPKNQSQLTDDQRRIQQIREKRESFQQLVSEKHHKAEQPRPVSVVDFSASGAGVQELAEDHSRYLPPA